MKKFLLLCLLCITLISVKAQENFWLSMSESLLSPSIFENKLKPKSFKVFKLNHTAMGKELKKVPLEKNMSAARSSFILSVPNANGILERYSVIETPVMDPALAAKYSGISSYTGKGIDHPASIIRFSMGLGNFQGMVLSTDRPSFYIDLIDEKQQQYIVFARPDMVDYKSTFQCLTDGLKSMNATDNNQSESTLNANDGTLRTYKIAMASTGEFSQFWLNGTELNDTERKAKVLVALNNAMTRTNGIYERDFGIRMVLVATNDLIIYLDPASDPWTNNFNSVTQTTIDNVIGDANYNIGHLVHRAGNNGNAGCIGCVCTPGQKGSAFTSYNNLNNFDFFVVDYLTHEIGHQFGGNHTHTHSGSEGTIAQVEPGSGSTIMGYAGITGPTTDVQPHSDDYFHAVNIQQITNYTRNSTGNSCAVITNTGNTTPTANAGADFIVPISTPFTLTGVGTDPNSTDVLSFCWEQMNVRATGFSTVPSATATAGPQFRSFLPSTSTSRTFPQLQYILSGANAWKWEQIPSVNRTLNFRFTVRDNRSGGGDNNSDNMVVSITNSSGPFLITSQNTTGISYNGSSTQTVTWSVNNTTEAPISCANVAIELSLDGGQTFPIVLAASTANDGTENIVFPNNPTTLARIRVRSVGNIFFDINNAKFTLVAASPDFDFATPAPAQINCGTQTSAVINLNTSQTLSYNVPILLSAIAGVPAGSSINFSTNPINPSSNVDVTLTNTNNLQPGNYDITIQGVSGTITKTRVIRFTVLTGAGPSITLNPSSQSICNLSNVTFTSSATGALSQQWQLSIDGGATWNNINLQTATSLTLTGVTIAQNNYIYRCVYTGLCNISTTNGAVLSIQTAPTLSQQPSNASICAGTGTTFSVSASGSNITYQWQLSTDAGVSWNNISAASNQLSITNTTVLQNNHQYRCIVSGTCTPALTSNAAILNVTAPVVISTQPADAIFCGSGNPTFTVSATNSNNGFQWQLSTDGGINYTNVTGAITNTLNVNATSTSFNNYRYRTVINNGVCPVVNSSAALLTINPLPVVTLSAAPYTKVFPGLTTTITATITPAGGTVVWQKNGLPFTNSSNSLNVNIDQLGAYKVIVTGAGGCVGESNVLNILDSATSKIFFYPNPNQGQFQVRYNNPQGSSTKNNIRVFDSKGVKVYDRKFSVTRPYDQMFIDLRARGTGIYFVELADASGRRLAVGRVYIQ